AGKNSDLIGLLALGREPALAGAALVEEMLDGGLLERDQGRAVIYDAANGWTVALAKGCDPEEMAKCVVGHGTQNSVEKRTASLTKTYGAPSASGFVICLLKPAAGVAAPMV